MTVQPGEKCPTCERRVNHPKKKDSPQSKVTSYRIPLDDPIGGADSPADTHNEIAEAAAVELGIFEDKYWKWKLNAYCYALVLTGHRLEELGG